MYQFQFTFSVIETLSHAHCRTDCRPSDWANRIKWPPPATQPYTIRYKCVYMTGTHIHKKGSLCLVANIDTLVHWHPHRCSHFATIIQFRYFASIFRTPQPYSSYVVWCTIRRIERKTFRELAVHHHHLFFSLSVGVMRWELISKQGQLTHTKNTEAHMFAIHRRVWSVIRFAVSVFIL